jgi:hypothetical protein
MANENAQDTAQVIALLRAALGNIDTNQPLKRLFEKAPQCGPFEWMLTILAIEIDLRVDVPEKLADNRKLTAAQFAKKVCSLPKVTSGTYTLDCLGLVAQALLLLEPEIAEEKPQKKRAPATRKKAPAKKAPAKKTPAKKTPAKKTPAKKTPAKKAAKRSR